VANLHQLTLHSTTSCPSIWRSYRAMNAQIHRHNYTSIKALTI